MCDVAHTLASAASSFQAVWVYDLSTNIKPVYSYYEHFEHAYSTTLRDLYPLGHIKESSLCP